MIAFSTLRLLGPFIQCSSKHCEISFGWLLDNTSKRPITEAYSCDVSSDSDFHLWIITAITLKVYATKHNHISKHGYQTTFSAIFTHVTSFAKTSKYLFLKSISS